MPAGVAYLPGPPESGFVARAVAAVAQPVQLHAQRLKVTHRRCFLSVTPQQAGGGEAEALAGGGQGVQVVGVVAAEADQARGFVDAGLLQVMAKLEPLVAADQRVDQVQPQDGGLDIGSRQPRQAQGLQGRLREVEKHRASLPAKSWGCFAAPAISEFRRQP